MHYDVPQQRTRNRDTDSPCLRIRVPRHTDPCHGASQIFPEIPHSKRMLWSVELDLIKKRYYFTNFLFLFYFYLLFLFLYFFIFFYFNTVEASNFRIKDWINSSIGKRIITT